MSTMTHTCKHCGAEYFDNEVEPPHTCSICGSTRFSSVCDEYATPPMPETDWSSFDIWDPEDDREARNFDPSLH
jgi:predicted  nucleic acid-binding Zn-ribbon protein